MKKAIWIIALLSLIATAAAIQFMPDTVPMHYGFSGEVDRFGSKYENLIFPGVIFAFAAFWHILISAFEKKAQNAEGAKERAGAASNAKVMKIAGVCVTALFTLMQGYVLFTAYRGADGGESPDIGRICCILAGAALVVLGNVMPKTRNNGTIGFRTKWSRYNDATWMKTNRFGAVALVAAGAATVVIAVFAPTAVAVAATCGCLLAACAATLAYSHKVYEDEIAD